MMSEDGVPLSDPAVSGAPQEFERRVRSLLEESAERLDGSVRSRLTRARYAALEARRSPVRGTFGAWLPVGAGAVAASALVAVALIVGVHRGSTTVARVSSVPVMAAAAAPSAPSVDDLELIADNDAIELPNADDYDFYEWAAAQPAPKSAGEPKSGGEEIGS